MICIYSQEKQAKEEQERLEALRIAENENRRIRHDAQYQGRHQNYGENDKYGFPKHQPSSQHNHYNHNNVANNVSVQDNNTAYEFDSGRSSKQSNKYNTPMDVNELSEKLNDINNKGGKGNRYIYTLSYNIIIYNNEYQSYYIYIYPYIY